MTLDLSCLVCRGSSGHALIRYTNLGSSVYAKEKLNGFEYPPGNRLVVNFVDDGDDRSRYTRTHLCHANVNKQQLTPTVEKRIETFSKNTH